MKCSLCARLASPRFCVRLLSVFDLSWLSVLRFFYRATGRATGGLPGGGLPGRLVCARHTAGMAFLREQPKTEESKFTQGITIATAPAPAMASTRFDGGVVLVFNRARMRLMSVFLSGLKCDC